MRACAVTHPPFVARAAPRPRIDTFNTLLNGLHRAGERTGWVMSDMASCEPTARHSRVRTPQRPQRPSLPCPRRSNCSPHPNTHSAALAVPNVTLAPPGAALRRRRRRRARCLHAVHAAEDAA
eukprot:6703836-Prymnesium_polylepis.1